MNTISIILTSFLRDNLLKDTINSITENWVDGYTLLIGDQNPNEEKNQYYNSLDPNIKYYPLPFDFGLSASRNYLVKEADKLGIKYIFLTADSIQFTDKYNLNPIIDFMESYKDVGIVGFNLLDRVPWEVDMKFIKGKGWELDIPRRSPIKFNSISFQQCDVVKNFFLAKTKCLLENRWDEELKLMEHEDFFYRLKQTNWEVFYTESVVAKYVNHKSAKYNVYRQRMYSIFKAILQKKYNINGWVFYTVDLQKVFSSWRWKG